MIVIIRADSSSKMGSGHLMRCLTLAEELCEERNANILFICRDLPGNLSNIVEGRGYQLRLLPYDESQQVTLKDLSEHKQWLGASVDTDRDQTIEVIKNQGKVDLLVVDNYALDEAWETPMRQYVKRIMAIDDLADRKHDCDILLDQNYYKEYQARYDNLVPQNCVKMLGPVYALIRNDIKKYRPISPRKIVKVTNILVNFGSSDPKNYCLKLIKMLQKHHDDFSQYDFLFVTGGMSTCKDDVFSISDKLSFCNAIESSNDFGRLMSEADLFIGAAGSTSWERCYLGLPALVCSVASNQKAIEEAGHGSFSQTLEIDTKNLSKTMLKMIKNNETLNRLSEKGLEITKTNFILNSLFYDVDDGVVIRLIQQSDAVKMLAWRNHKKVREHSLNDKIISLVEHEKWLYDALRDETKLMLIASSQNKDIGVVSFSNISDESQSATVNIYLNPNMVGRGYGTVLLKAGLEHLREKRGNVKFVDAVILKNNTVSINMFKKCNFMKYSEKNKIEKYRLSI